MDEHNETYWGPKLWALLRSQQPDFVCRRSRADWDPGGFYEMSSLGQRVRVYPSDERLECADEEFSSNVDYQLLLVSYLTGAQNIDPAGSWLSEKELTGGSIFFRGPHALPAAPLEKRFGSDPEGFREKASALSGRPLDFGDVSMVFPILPRISFAIILWTADEEFPARVTFMFDSTVTVHLEPYVILAMTQSVTQKLLG